MLDREKNRRVPEGLRPREQLCLDLDDNAEQYAFLQRDRRLSTLRK